MDILAIGSSVKVLGQAQLGTHIVYGEGLFDDDSISARVGCAQLLNFSC
jgi:hypothetical protein